MKKGVLKNAQPYPSWECFAVKFHSTSNGINVLVLRHFMKIEILMVAAGIYCCIRQYFHVKEYSLEGKREIFDFRVTALSRRIYFIDDQQRQTEHH